jgi:hypothetical protein
LHALAVDDETFARTLSQRKIYIRKTIRITAIRTGKMRMALTLGAVMGQLEMPRPLVKERLMHKTRFEKCLQRAVDCYPVRGRGAEPGRNLVRRLWFPRT